MDTKKDKPKDLSFLFFGEALNDFVLLLLYSPNPRPTRSLGSRNTRHGPRRKGFEFFFELFDLRWVSYCPLTRLRGRGLRHQAGRAHFLSWLHSCPN
jgi:hypothetical protein